MEKSINSFLKKVWTPANSFGGAGRRKIAPTTYEDWVYAGSEAILVRFKTDEEVSTDEEVAKNLQNIQNSFTFEQKSKLTGDVKAWKNFFAPLVREKFKVAALKLSHSKLNVTLPIDEECKFVESNLLLNENVGSAKIGLNPILLVAALTLLSSLKIKQFELHYQDGLRPVIIKANANGVKDVNEIEFLIAPSQDI